MRAELYVPDDYVEGPRQATVVARMLGAPPEELQRRQGTRQQILDHAYAIGLIITNDEANTDAYPLMGDTLEYEDERRLLAEEVPEAKYPEVRSAEAFREQPFFPAVAKHTPSDLGDNKFLLEDPEQWYKMERFLWNGAPWVQPSEDDLDQLSKHRVILDATDPTDTTYKQAYDNWRTWDWYVQRKRQPASDDFMDMLRSNVTFEEYVETPSEYSTSYRTLTTATGDVLASSLLYGARSDTLELVSTSKRHVDTLSEPGANLFDHLTHPESNLYLASRKFQSNRSSGGGGIVLDPTRASKPPTATERRILAAHNINPRQPTLPAQLRELSRQIGITLGPHLGILMGIDFVQQAKSDSFKLLEANGGPGFETYIDAYYGGKPNADAEFAMYRHALNAIAYSKRS